MEQVSSRETSPERSPLPDVQQQPISVPRKVIKGVKTKAQESETESSSATESESESEKAKMKAARRQLKEANIKKVCAESITDNLLLMYIILDFH